MHTISDFPGEDKLPITLTQIFNNYVTYELIKLSDKQVKMSKFFKYVASYANTYSVGTLASRITINNQDVKSIYFDEYPYYNLEFTIHDSNNLEIVIDEKHRTDIFSMIKCKNIVLKFNLTNNKKDFVPKNNFLLKQCNFQTIEIKAPTEHNDQIKFNHQLNFFNCEIEKMNIKNLTFNNSLTFNGNSVFKESVNFDGKIFNANIKFKDCKFEKNISFNKAIFEKEVEFQNCTFNKADFSSAIFKDNAYFNNSEFNGAFMLYRAQFYKIADFFNLEFNDIYNFSSCAFKEPEFVSFIGFKTNISIETLKNYTERISIRKIATKEYLQKKLIWIENLKNSFAVIKHNFLQRDNLIEANKHKVLEFYAEELRLKYECGIKNKCCLVAFFELICAIFIHPRQTINYLQLLFYRHTSNHHSDLLKSFNTMLLLIGLFAACNYLIVLGFNTYCLDNTTTYNIHGHIKLYEAHINYFISTHETWHIFVANLLIILAFLGIFVLLLCLKNLTFIAKNWFFAIINWLFILINRTIVLLSYLFTLALLAISPKSIISITNLFSGNQHILDPLSALSGIYTILFILLIYSLQKTSRRNSIM